MKFFQFACISVFWVILFVGSRSNTVQAQERALEFCYEDPKCGPLTWPGICQTGRSQSPVNLPYNHSDHIRHARLADLVQSPDYFRQSPFILTNNGHSVQVSLKNDLTSTCTLEGTLLGGQYVFSQAHFHWGGSDDRGSEHTLNNDRYPMEIHLVHYSAQYTSFTEALNSNKVGAVAVIAVFFQIGDGDSKSLAPIITAMNELQCSGRNTTTGDNLNLSLFLFQSRDKDVDVIQYTGSLTTPSCNEGVLWSVFTYPAPISARQMAVFRNVRVPSNENNLVNNFRPTQALNGREISAAVSSIQ